MSKMVSLVKGFSNKLFLLSTCLYFIGFLIAKKEGKKGGRREEGRRGESTFEKKKAGGRKRKTSRILGAGLSSFFCVQFIKETSGFYR